MKLVNLHNYTNLSDFIVRELEVRCFRLGLIDSVVPEALLNMNLDPDVLLDIYAR